MGIQGLLQFLKEASEPVSVRKYKGQTVAVDTYCWLHKGAFACAEKLAKGEPTDLYVRYCMKFVGMLLSFGVKPILVFDGCNLPSKRDVEKARRERRQANLQKGKQLLREGRLSEARDCFTRSINVTPAMAHDVIKAARAQGVDCVVAPYEADAQLAFLNKAGIAQAIITEDSDLLAFGCKKVILKMDKLGNGLEIDQSHLGRCKALGNVFTEEKFRYMCILSGCDYLASLYGIGLGKACKLLKVASNPDILTVIRRMGQYLKMNVTVSDEYVEGFVKANNTFLYQLVFDPISRKVVPLNPYLDGVDPSSLPYAGHNVGDKKGLQMALGNIDINTMQKIDDYNPDTVQPAKPRSHSWNDSKKTRSALEVSIWGKGYTPSGFLPSQPATPDSPPEKPSTRGKERLVSVQGLRLPHRELQVKRPREDSSVSEEDVLQQYSAPGLKRRREDGRVSSEASPEPRARNRFATLLQRRNRDDEPGDGQCTRSRFFSDVGSSETASPELEARESECPEDRLAPPGNGLHDDAGAKAEETEGHGEGTPNPSPPSSQGTLSPPSTKGTPTLASSQGTLSPPSSQSPRLTGRGRGAFNWSSSCSERPRTPGPTTGLSALQRFQRTKDAFSWDAPCPRDPPYEGNTPMDSPPSQDSAYFSQPGRTSFGGEDTPTHRHHRNSPNELDTSQESDFNISSSPVMVKNPTGIGAKVSGLPRGKSTDLGKGGKIRPSAPARASGLRKKPTGSGRRCGSNSENTPGVQATISSLWENFGFRRERPKVIPGKKGEPMSPVGDNVPALTPENITDIGFNPQKSVCL